MRPSQLKDFIKLSIKNNINIIIKGKPGVGKTDISKQVVEEVIAECGGSYMITHPVMKDPTEYTGLGFPSKDRKSAEFLPYGDLLAMIEAKELLVVIIDDLGQATPLMQAALMQLIQERNVNGKKISPHVRFLACTNERSHKAGVQMVLEPLKGRACIVELEINDNDWRKDFAIPHDLPPEIIAFSKLRPDLLNEFTPTSDMTNSNNPRNWARAAMYQNVGIARELEYEVFQGCAGEKFAAEYTGFLKMYREMPDPQEYIDNPDKDLPDNESVCYALSAALAHMATRKNVDRIFKIAMRLDAEFSTFMVFSMIQKNNSLAETPGMVGWATKYSDYLL